MHKKFTLSFACLIFFFIGAPLGAIIGRGGIGTPIVVSVILFIVYYIIDTSGLKLAREGEVPVWWGRWVSTVVLGPLGVILTHQANKDSGVFNVDIYKNAFRWLLALRPKRNLTMKEVIIDDPDYAIILRELEELTTACKTYNHTHKPGRLPNYVHLFANHSRDRSLLAINVRLNDIIEQLGNSRRQDILNLLNAYPVISAGAHSSPFSRRWMNITVGIVFPAGILFYARAYFFRRRLSKDLRQLVKINKEIQYLINERIFK
jgi:lipopolysaccharide export system permease protein